MAFRFEFAQEAIDRAEEAYAWLLRQSQSERLAARWYEGLFEKIETLKLNPERCPLAEEVGAYGEPVRLLLYGERSGVYKIYFAIRDDLILIYSIRHAARGRD
jgi:plasmid stabilization system protein ParE